MTWVGGSWSSLLRDVMEDKSVCEFKRRLTSPPLDKRTSRGHSVEVLSFGHVPSP